MGTPLKVEWKITFSEHLVFFIALGWLALARCSFMAKMSIAKVSRVIVAKPRVFQLIYSLFLRRRKPWTVQSWNKRGLVVGEMRKQVRSKQVISSFLFNLSYFNKTKCSKLVLFNLKTNTRRFVLFRNRF